MIPDLIEDLIRTNPKVVENMQIIKEKPKIDPVFKTHISAMKQEIEQKDRSNDIFKIYSCLKEFETANFETQIPKMNLTLSSNSSSLAGSIYVEKTGLAVLHTVKKNSSYKRLELTETDLQAAPGWMTEAHSSRLGPETGN